jgi:hypothetical protein
MMVPAPFLRFTARVEFDGLYVRSSHDEMPLMTRMFRVVISDPFGSRRIPAAAFRLVIWASWELDQSSSARGSLSENLRPRHLEVRP